MFAQNTPTEQRLFSAEDERVQRPVSLPSVVVEMLARDPDVKGLLENEHLSIDKAAPVWFMASAVRLAGVGERDLVVIGKGPVLGANITTFWLFRPTASGFELLMNAPAHTLIVKNARTKGYKDVELLAGTAVTVSTVLCKFNGKIYVPSRKTLKAIR